MPVTKTIQVLAVPEPAHDGFGSVGAVPFAGAPSRYVGAEIDTDASEKAGKIRFKFSDEPVEVPFDAYYLRAVQEGHLMAADEESEKLCGIFKPTAEAKALPQTKVPFLAPGDDANDHGKEHY